MRCWIELIGVPTGRLRALANARLKICSYLLECIGNIVAGMSIERFDFLEIDIVKQIRHY